MRVLSLALALGVYGAPHVARVSPLGGQAGTVVEVEFTGKELAGFIGARFDTDELQWVETTSTTAELVRGKVRIGAGAALGPHRVQALGATGPANTRLFNVFQFPDVREVEPRQRITLRPQVIHGYMQGLADQDFFTFSANAGERWVFDLQSMERGGFLECSLTLSDAAGKEVAFNDDQDEFLETPRLVVRFPKTGEYTLKIDQYRGPQGVSCDSNCGYALQISQLPVVMAVFPLGARPGATYKARVTGEGLEGVTGAYMQRARGAEHYRLTFPFSMPVDGGDRDLARISGSAMGAAAGAVDVTVTIPATARPGLWRLWLVTKHGVAEAMSLEIDADARTMDGRLDGSNAYPVSLVAGTPFHAWTVATQLGLPLIDTVLELWSAEGKLLAEHDDLMTGQGTVIGNPDSSLYYTPNKTEQAKLVVRDRTDRTGESFVYRLHFDAAEPSFQLVTEPEELTVPSGGETTLTALLMKQPGFEKAVDVWVEGIATARGLFRAEQQFGPSGDGDNINIPSLALRLRIPAGTAPGDYALRVKGRAADSTGPVVEGFTTLWIGPRGNRNDTRRPLPAILVHVR